MNKPTDPTPSAEAREALEQVRIRIDEINQSGSVGDERCDAINAVVEAYAQRKVREALEEAAQQLIRALIPKEPQ